ncbi:hypothetical protein [Cryptosporangium phraense]|uniref:Uncharacterized protein n=1 Tax=Cryptosporangium phraense TaxID=2593070 RepID=A0A545AM30_9ACTN|nr:hypothetical protein [Cryptosporangium phraense]TQS42310.1 hypothetical protein FL583_25645 [Cryptosporangium phraense]
MIKNLMSTPTATAMPSIWSGKAVPLTARERVALTAHAYCAEVHVSQVSKDKSVLQAAKAGYVGNGITFGTPVQAQLSVDALRVDGRAGSPPRGKPA